jgi:hypothetical protein
MKRFVLLSLIAAFAIGMLSGCGGSDAPKSELDPTVLTPEFD